MCHQPILTPIQQNGHHTSIQYRLRRERTKVTLESTHAAIVKKGCLAFLMFSSTDLNASRSPFHQNPKHFPIFPAAELNHPLHTLQPLENITTSHLRTFSFKKFLSTNSFSHLCLQRLLAACQSPDIIRMKETSSIEVVDQQPLPKSLQLSQKWIHEQHKKCW